MDRLFEGIDVVETVGDPAVEITSVSFDSRRVEPGSLFCCVVGSHTDGHDFAAEALGRGAAALLVERPLGLGLPEVRVAPGQARHVMALVSARLYGHPARALTTVGVTGTNGKTTVTHMLASIFEAATMPCEVVGTLDGARTTPEAPDLEARLASARDAGRTSAAVEVSSHALVQGRVDGIVFDAAVFTNLSHDHLDFHGTMEDYFSAKALLFTPEHAALGVVNGDDPYGARLLARASIPMVAYHRSDASEVESSSRSTGFSWQGRRITMGVTGEYQVDNALAAAATARALGIDGDTVAAGLGALSPVAGRFEVVADDPFTVVVDYAHTPEGLATALRSARTLAGAGSRVICVFGCGGGRDRAKRPEMGAAAVAGADVVVVTSDNPRLEDPSAIIAEILAGTNGVDGTRAADEVDGQELVAPDGAKAGTVVVEEDRARAIDVAVELVRPGDVVVIAGKGHELGIEAHGVVTPFDDRAVAAAAVARRRAGRAHR